MSDITMMTSEAELHEIDLTHDAGNGGPPPDENKPVVVESPTGERVVVDLTRLTRTQLSRFQEKFKLPFPHALTVNEGNDVLGDLLDKVAFAAYLSSKRLNPDAAWLTEEWMLDNLEMLTAVEVAESMQKKMPAPDK